LKIHIKHVASGNRFSLHPVICTKVMMAGTDDKRAITVATARTLTGLVRRARPAWNIKSLVAQFPNRQNLNEMVAILVAMLQRIAGAGDVQPFLLDLNGGTVTAAVETLSRGEGIAAVNAALKLIENPDDGRFDDEFLGSLLRPLSAAVARRTKNMAVAAAERQGIPWSFVASTPYPIVSLGHGKHRQLFWRHIASGDSEIGTFLCDEKHLATEAIGWPIITKPVSAGLGKAVTTHIRNEQTLAKGYAEARQHGLVLVEQHIDGESHRIQICHGQCISIVRQTPAHVVGDGRQTVQELIDFANLSRSDDLSKRWKKMKIDENSLFVLRRQGFGVNDVPSLGQRVNLRDSANHSAGGTMERMTGMAHPDNVRLAAKAAAALQIDVAGVDFLTPDITKSYHDVGGAIIEVNVNVGFNLGEDERAIENAAIGGYFTDQRRGRVPIIALLEDAGSAELANLLPGIFEPEYSATATFGEDGVYVGNARIGGAGQKLPNRAALALSDYAVGSAVLTVQSGEYLEDGLGVDSIDVAVALNHHDQKARSAILGLAKSARAIVLPAKSGVEFRSYFDTDPAIWWFGDAMDSELPRGQFNRVFWRDQATLLISPAGASPTPVQFEILDQTISRDALLIFAAIATALGVASNLIPQKLPRSGK
jgi:hypothetical protein